MKKFLLIIGIIILIPFSVILVIAVPQILSKDPDATYELRGRYKPSTDGKTYLVIEDNNGGKCGPLYVDQKIWPHSLNNAGEIKPGDHIIECGVDNGIYIKEGTIYYFDYWGP